MESEPDAHKWKDIRKPLSPEAEERIQQGVKEAAAVMTLHQLREARSLTQVNLAKVLQINQGAVLKMEKRADMYVSTLRISSRPWAAGCRSKPSFPRAKSRSTSSKPWPNQRTLF